MATDNSDTRSVSLRIPETLYQQLADEALRDHRTLSDQMRWIVSQHLAREAQHSHRDPKTGNLETR
jgi:hypothetical protein